MLKEREKGDSSRCIGLPQLLLGEASATEADYSWHFLLERSIFADLNHAGKAR